MTEEQFDREVTAIILDRVDFLKNRIKQLEKELKEEKELNADIKVRFVKCSTCTDEMKNKCLMFSENLCEGERCTELVDLVKLVCKE